MSLRLEMLQVARRAPMVLGVEATALVEKFLWSKRAPDGGFHDRAGRSDLYYTVFGFDALAALQSELPLDELKSHLVGFGEGEGLDFVHLCCLMRLWSLFPVAERPVTLLRRIESWRSRDGGYNQRAGSSHTTAYGALLAGAAYLDSGLRPPRPWKLARALRSLRSADGGWSNVPGQPTGSTTATAAAVAFHRHARLDPPGELGRWLLAQVHPQGGFKAMPDAPAPDLLSTAVALHALGGLESDFSHLKDSLLDFVDTLWSAEGGFHGNWTEHELDVEYTYYGLLALGHLSF